MTRKGLKAFVTITRTNSSVDTSDALDFELANVGLREIAQSGGTAVALGGNHVPPALQVLLRQCEAKATRSADEQELLA